MSHRLREDFSCWLLLSFYRFLIYEPVTFKVFFLMERPSLGFLPRFFPAKTLFLGLMVPSSALSSSICIFKDYSIAYSSFGDPFFAAILLICLILRLFNTNSDRFFFNRELPFMFMRFIMPIIERSLFLMALYVSLASFSKHSIASDSAWMVSMMKSRVLW